MIFVGIDDTDLLDTPGTNKLARHLVGMLAPAWHGEVITRHQLLEDPRVPCTRKNGCVAIQFRPSQEGSVPSLIDAMREMMLAWCPTGSDPGLCVATSVPDEVVEFGRRVQKELVSQRDARELARQHDIYLEGLGGTQDGVIGALAAIGLAASRDDGRVTYLGHSETDLFDVSGLTSFAEVHRCGIDEVRCLDTQRLVDGGWIDVGKRLRPNLRQGKVILFVHDQMRTAADQSCWEAVRVL